MKTKEQVKHELESLQYSLGQLQMNQGVVDHMYECNTPRTQEYDDELEDYRKRFIEFHEKRNKDWEKKVTEAAGFEYDESEPFDREKMQEILGEKMYEIPRIENKEFIIYPEDDEKEIVLSSIEGMKILEKDFTDQLDNYLEVINSDHHEYFFQMGSALHEMVKWGEDYSKRINVLEIGKIDEREMERFKASSEFVWICSEWLSSTVSTLLKLGFKEDFEKAQ